MNSLPKYVVSETLQKAEWNNSRLIKGNLPDEISKLKQQPGQDILVFGSCSLAQALMRHGLVDGYKIMSILNDVPKIVFIAPPPGMTHPD
jgi:dihydrofolate reductase